VNLVLTFCETPTAVFDPVIDRIRTNVGGRIRRLGADYLAWAILDAIVDNYLSVIDHLDDAVVAIDEKLQLDDRSAHVGEIYALKREINRVFRTIRPIREIAISLLRENETLLTPASRPYYVDLNDHAIQAIETTEYLREGSNSLREFYLSSASNRMNEVMKVLTCFSTIFLPLTFIAGIYGMNFEHMPELQHRWAYPAIWIIFLLCAAGMFWLFRRMRWL
jgi:magnesium transporter